MRRTVLAMSPRTATASTPSTTGAPAAPAERFAMVESPVGDLVLTGGGPWLSGCWFTGPGHRTDPTVGRERDDDAFEDARAQLAEYFAGDRRQFDLDLRPSGTEFQVRVWALLREIPYGETWSYGQMADKLANPGASRAVGLANGRNPHSIIVPCHRVIGADGSLTGFGGGMDRKRFLLDLEAGIRPLA
jgi:methylated-DNA-[protein]-cysteine S-methyltransferase